MRAATAYIRSNGHPENGREQGERLAAHHPGRDSGNALAGHDKRVVPTPIMRDAL